MKKPAAVMRALWKNRARRNPAGTRCWQCPVELLERRIVPTLTANFAATTGTLTVIATAAESIAVTNVSGNVAVNGNVAFGGVGTSTASAVVARLIVQGGTGVNDINLGGVTEAAFTILSAVSITGGQGNDVIVGSGVDDTIVWNNGDGSDRIDGGAGQDKLVVSGSTTAADAFSVAASAGRLMFRRTNLTAFTLNVGSVEDLVVSAGGGNDTIKIGNTLNSGLINVSLFGGAGEDTVNLTGINLDELSLLTVDGEEGNDVIIASAGTGANNTVADQFVLSLVDTVDGPEVELSVNGTTIFAGADESAFIQIEGSRDVDSLTVIHDATLGSPVPFNGLLFNAGGGIAQDQLVITGAAETAVYDFSNVRNGSAQVDLRTIRFVHLESISDTSLATARTVFFANGADRVSLSDTEGIADRFIKVTSVGSGPVLTLLQAVGGSLTVDTGAGNDTINIRRLDNNFSGDLLLDGSGGNDRIVIDNQLNVMGTLNISADGGEGRDTIDASAVTQGVVLFGGAGDDMLVGGSGNDALSGQEGADVLTGGTGSDMLDGGVDADVLVESANANLTLTATSLTGIGTDAIVGFERAELTGGDSSNIIDATTFTGAVVLRGGGGNDELIGTAFNDTMFGGAGNDTMSGLAGADVLNGEGNDDLLTGGQGNDQLSGGDGNDDFEWVNGDSSDAISGGLGSDVLQVSGHATDGDVFRLTSGGSSGARLERTNLVPFTLNFNKVESLVVEGNGGADSLSIALNASLDRPSDITFGGGTGNDTLEASMTSVPIFAFGDAGDDLLIGGRGADTLQGGDDKDVLTGNSGADVLNGNAGDDTINGGSGNDLLNGGDGIDMLDGGADNDAIAGFAGIDVIRGGSGRDTLAGGTGGPGGVDDGDSFPDTVPGTVEIDNVFMFTLLPNWINDA